MQRRKRLLPRLLGFVGLGIAAVAGLAVGLSGGGNDDNNAPAPVNLNTPTEGNDVLTGTPVSQVTIHCVVVTVTTHSSAAAVKIRLMAAQVSTQTHLKILA